LLFFIFLYTNDKMNELKLVNRQEISGPFEFFLVDEKLVANEINLVT